jgi:hypothetical protein
MFYQLVVDERQAKLCLIGKTPVERSFTHPRGFGNLRHVNVGDLTIRGITRQVVLDAEYAGKARSPWGTVSAGFAAITSIDRRDWGLTWNQALETGGILVGDTIKIEIEVELVEQPESLQVAGEVVAAD